MQINNQVLQRYRVNILIYNNIAVTPCYKTVTHCNTCYTYENNLRSVTPVTKRYKSVTPVTAKNDVNNCYSCTYKQCAVTPQSVTPCYKVLH